MLRLVLIALFGLSQLGYGNYLDRPEAQQLIDELVAEYELERADLEQTLSRAEHLQSVIEAISRPAERRLHWYEYREIFLQPRRIQRGIDFWQRNFEALARAEAEYGVDPQVIVAIIGVETDYGRVMGSYKALDALSTLAFDYPPRSEFFRKELGQLLVLAAEEGKDAYSLTSSYAGALGMGQFMPSSFRAFAVDFAKDGVRDIWTSEEDVIGSVANYLAVHGWRHENPVIMPVELPTELDFNAFGPTIEISEAPSLAELKTKGVAFEDPAWSQVDESERVMMTSFDFRAGAAHYGGLMNFYVITRYNRSHMYAFAVHKLATEVQRGYEALHADD